MPLKKENLILFKLTKHVPEKHYGTFLIFPALFIQPVTNYKQPARATEKNNLHQSGRCIRTSIGKQGRLAGIERRRQCD
jgi:hypothetical protein